MQKKNSNCYQQYYYFIVASKSQKPDINKFFVRKKYKAINITYIQWFTNGNLTRFGHVCMIAVAMVMRLRFEKYLPEM